MTYSVVDAGGNKAGTFNASPGDQVAVFKYNPTIPNGVFLTQFVVPAVAPPPVTTTLPDLVPSPAGTVGDATHVAKITTNAKGLVTGVEAVAIAVSGGGGGPVTIQGGSLARPANETELLALLQGVASSGGGLAFDGSTPPVHLTKTLVVNLSDVGDGGIYINGNGLRLTSDIKDGTTAAIRFIGATRFLTLTGFNLYGGGFDTPGCGNGWEIIASGGDIALCTFSNLVASWCGGDGFVFQGAVFESDTYSLKAKDCKGSGCTYSGAGGVVSNMMMYGSSLSRNNNYGLNLINGAESVDLIGGSFITNGLGGVQGPIRNAICGNGENTGEFMFNFGATGIPYTSTVIGWELSSNHKTTRGEQPNAKVSQAVFDNPGTLNLQQSDNYVSSYTDG